MVPCRPGGSRAGAIQRDRAHEIMATSEHGAFVATLIEIDGNDGVDRFSAIAVIFPNGEQAAAREIERHHRVAEFAVAWIGCGQAVPERCCLYRDDRDEHRRHC